ncbi:MAG: response regulator [Gammaproteobacteria bacterium]|jgi:DNA-binding response OmpR family regulator|nr:response regulator [Gammaproteobacteria bacterium]MBT7370020.1 response regulator [Gammaproteobacteria bacterium]
MNESLANLLIVEDEPITRSQLTAHFEKEGYAVMTSEDAEGVVDSIEDNLVDICLIDINLPGKDGLTLTRELRATSDLGIILVTGKDDPVDKIVGLESGADDYVTKPFDPRELLSRVKNLLWRVKAQEKQKEKGFKRKFEGWILDLNKRELSTPTGEIQPLSAGEFHLLLALIESAGQVMTRDQLMNRIRNREWYPDDRYIDVLVGQVRRKFRQFDADTTFISTIHGTGYLFAPSIS